MRKLVAALAVAGLAVAFGGVPASGQTEDLETFCGAVADASIRFNQFDSEDASKKEQKRFARKVGDDVDTAEETAPADIVDQVAIAAPGIRVFLASGKEPGEEIQEANRAIDAYVADNCGYQVVDVIGVEYEFQGIPDTLEPGTTIFRFTNNGAEVHELAIAKIKGDESAEDIAEESPEHAEEKLKFVAHSFGIQGQTEYTYVKLKAGRFAALCFIPVGTTDPEALEEEDHEGGGDAASHAAEGMFFEFEVEK